MAYTINNYNGTTLATIADGTLDSSTSLRFAGRNFAGYGEYLNENQLWLLQNFSSPLQPTTPITGQIWYNSQSGQLAVYNGTAFKTIANTDNLTSAVSTINSTIQTQIGLVNANIVSNVSTLSTQIDAQAEQFTELLANAVTQNSSIVSLWANAATQTASLQSLNNSILDVDDRVDSKSEIDSPTFTGTPKSVTPNIGDDSTNIATTEYVMRQDTLRKNYIDSVVDTGLANLSNSVEVDLAAKADLTSPHFLGTPTAQTPVIGNRSESLATTSYVMSQDDIQRAYIDNSIASNVSILSSSFNTSMATKAPLANPVFTGTVTVPDPAIGDSSTKAASTSFVQQTVAASSPWQGSRKFVSTDAPDPGQGVNGDFWFQYL